MKRLTLRKYIITALKFFVPFVLGGALCLILWIADALAWEVLLFIAVAVNGVALLLPSVYYFSMYLVFKKKCEGCTPTEGVVTNWELGFFRYSGSIIVKVDDKEYSTSAYFSSEEAKELVGKTVSYAIIDDTLFVYEIK